MSFALLIQDEAKAEIREAYNWYLQKSSVAASNFENEVTNAFDILMGGATEYREVIAGVRMLPLAVFPYNVYYRRIEREKSVQVIAVLYSKRNPDFILKHLKTDY